MIEKQSQKKIKKIGVYLDNTEKVELNKIISLQGDLKKASPTDIRKLKNSLKKNGIRFPVFVWKHSGKIYSIDGIHRKTALKELESEGWEIPHEIPCVYVHAENIAEAKKLLMIASSSYARVTQSGFNEFSDGLDLSEIIQQIAIEGIKFETGEIQKESNHVVEEMVLKDFESYDYLVFLFDDSRDFINVMQKFGVSKMAVGYSEKNVKMGIGRLIKGERLLEALDCNTVAE